jgi:hypothetical protein
MSSNEYLEASRLAVVRSRRLIDSNTTLTQELMMILTDIFGDLDDNIQTGLRKKYYKYKQHIRENGDICMTSYGRTLPDSPETYIGMYISPANKQVPLYASNLCGSMLEPNVYFADIELIDECIKTPNIHLYLEE